jgi:dienelactone hydrolase
MTEIPVFIPAGKQSLFGVLTSPGGGSQSLIVVNGPGGPNAALFQRNGVATRLARRLADAGFSTMRFDYVGIGDSTGDLVKFDLEKPLREDVNAVLTWAKAAGFTRFGLVGICFGTRTALSVMDNADKVSALVLSTMPFADVMTVLSRRMGTSGLLKRLLKPATWMSLTDPGRRRSYAKLLRSLWRRSTGRRPDRASGSRPSAMSRLRTASQSNVPVLMLYGSEDRHYLNAAPSLESLRGVLSGLEVDASYPGELHGFPTLEGQDVFVDKVVSWLTARMGVSVQDPAPVEAEGRS